MYYYSIKFYLLFINLYDLMKYLKKTQNINFIKKKNFFVYFTYKLLHNQILC